MQRRQATAVHRWAISISLLGAAVAAAADRPAPTVKVQQRLDLVYAVRGDRKLSLDLFSPTAAGRRPRPGVVVVHGGGWLKGDKTKFHPLARALASRGYVAAAIQYRLGGEARFPAAIHDCNAAVRWLRAHADRYGIDPARIVAVGGSAGGHLVGLMAAGAGVSELAGDGPHADRSSSLQAAAVMAGPMQLASGAVADKSRRQADANVNRWLGKTVDQAPALYALASPVTHFSKATPPMLFMVGEHDNPQRNLEARGRLRSLNVRTDVRVYKDGKHGCWHRQPWFDIMVDDLDAFFTSVLYRQESSTSTPASPPVRRRVSTFEWGEMWVASGVPRTDDRPAVEQLELRVTKKPADGVITIPRLNNRIGRVVLQGEPSETALTLKPGTDTWSIQAADSGAKSTVLVELLERFYLPTIPRIVAALRDGSVTLSAHDSVTRGRLIRFEPQPHKNTVGYWADEKDTCHWHFYLDRPGAFELFILQGCGKGQGGSLAEVSVGDERVEFSVEDTGHFQNFKSRKLGRIEIASPGVHTLQIRALKKAAKAVMDVRQVRLVRRGE